MCYLCETNPVYEFTNKRKVCKNCFIKYFQKKFLYIIRKYGLIKKEEKICFFEKKDFRSVVLRYLLEGFFTKYGNELIEIKNLEGCKPCDKVALEDSADVVSKDFFNKIVNEKNIIPESFLVFDENKKIIRPLYLFLDKEIKLYAGLKNLDYDKKVSENNIFDNFIDGLEKKHLELKTSVISSCLKLFL